MGNKLTQERMKEILDETFPTTWRDLNGNLHDGMDHSDELLDGIVKPLPRNPIAPTGHLLRDAVNDARDKEKKKMIAFQMGRPWEFKDETKEEYRIRRYGIQNKEASKEEKPIPKVPLERLTNDVVDRVKGSAMGMSDWQYQQFKQETNQDY